MIDIKIDMSSAADGLQRLAQGLQQRSPLMREIAALMGEAVEDNFAAQGRPAWAGLKSASRRGGKLLQDTGRLAGSVTQQSDNNTAAVGTNVKYAAIHQFGGQTSPHVIRPRNKRALAFGGRVVKSLNHPGSAIPARPFLQLAPADEERIAQTVEDYLRRLIG